MKVALITIILASLALNNEVGAEPEPQGLGRLPPPDIDLLGDIFALNDRVTPRQRQRLPKPKNPYLSKVYGGNWFRSNFQDLFSYKGAQKLEWFEVLEGNDCSPVPATVNAGRPPRDICLEAAVDERRCICINTGRGRSETGYEPICGNCRDPCQLKFTPEKFLLICNVWRSKTLKMVIT